MSKVNIFRSVVFLAFLDQMNVGEYGEGPEKDMLQFLLARNFHLVVGQLWFGQVSLHKLAELKCYSGSSQVRNGGSARSCYAFDCHYFMYVNARLHAIGVASEYLDQVVIRWFN